MDATAQALRDTYGAEVITAIADVSQRTDMQAAVARTLAQFGRLDIVCCNAGVARLAPFEAMSDELLDLHINVNIRGVWNTCQAAIGPMLKQGEVSSSSLLPSRATSWPMQAKPPTR